MGLDMYLTKNTYIGNTWAKDPDDPNSHGIRDLVPVGPALEAIGIRSKRVTSITEQLAYWRKSNQIHRWFVENVQDGNDDCGTYSVSREQLVELRDLCVRVIEASETVDDMVYVGSHAGPDTGGKMVRDFEPGKVILNPEVAEELLPSQAGFFFGGTDYDQFYLKDLEYTRDQLDAVLADWPEDGLIDVEYHSSW